MARFAADAPLNTDDHPVVSYLAPRATYEPEATPAVRLATLLQQWSVEAQDVLGPQATGPAPERLKAYVQARRHYLAAGVGVQAVADPVRMLAQVRQPLLATLQMSPDFLPAYEPLLRLAVALKARDPLASEALLQDLTRLAPAQPGAWAALR